MEISKGCTLHQWVSSCPGEKGTVGYYYNDWRKERLSLETFVEKIQDGHYWTNVYTSFEKKKQTFVSTQSICLIVKSGYMMPEYLHQMEEAGGPMPTFAYVPDHRCKNGIFQFRMVYCFDEEITRTQYEMVFNALAKAISYNPKDHSWYAGQAMIAAYAGCDEEGEIEMYGTIYQISDFYRPKGFTR